MGDARDGGVLRAAIPIGAKADIRVDAGLYKGHYPSRVEDLTEDAVSLAHPMFKGALLPIYRDMAFELLVEAERAPLIMRVLTLRTDLRGVVPLLLGRIQGEIQRLQRRRFLRLPWRQSIRAFPLDHEVQAPLEGHWFEAVTSDISLGGVRLRFLHRGRFQPGDRLLLRLGLGEEGEAFLLVGKVMRLIGEQTGEWDVGLEFESLPPFVERELMDFVRRLERQRQGS
jgi:c-di-GMP-binding flagellar brake protein YcgR